MMDQANAATQLDAEQEYRAIEATLLGSARGRWFLAEHGRRARRLDTAVLQDAIGRLQSSLREPPALLGQLQNEIQGLQGLLHQTRKELTAKPQPRTETTGLEAQPGATGILQAAEGLHELAWSLQSQEVDAATCEKIGRQANAIFALSARHAAECERVQSLTQALDGALARLDGLLESIGHEQQTDDFTDPPPPDPTSPDDDHATVSYTPETTTRIMAGTN